MMSTSSEYNDRIDTFRNVEYPMLKDQIYLDHAGTTLYSKSLMEAFTQDLMSNLYGNPHSASPSSQLSSKRIDDVRLKVLQFFRADPHHFDLVFVANATAGIKLIMDAFRSHDNGYSYLYHRDAHTSLVGVRENASESACLTDQDVEAWLADSSLHMPELPSRSRLFAYPAQSNMNGRRLPLQWSNSVRRLSNDKSPIYTLLDAAALVSTAPLHLADPEQAPDFVVLSFNKIFGFPDLGALIVRRQAAHTFEARKYFGGGTVDAIVCDTIQPWHIPKQIKLHDNLEDGTLPIHNIIALDAAIKSHHALYESMERISAHTMSLATRLYTRLKSLQHESGLPCCQMYSDEKSFQYGSIMQGPVVTFNVRSANDQWHSNAEIEKLAAVRGIHIRTGGMCNSGGIAAALNLSPHDILANYALGFRCGGDNDIMRDGSPTGVIRVSIGAMNTTTDVDKFYNFIREFYVETVSTPTKVVNGHNSTMRPQYYVQRLTVYPIKSCGGYEVPDDIDWTIKPEGLQWDREWCLIHRGTGLALSQKRYPRMVLFRPTIDLHARVLHIEYVGKAVKNNPTRISVPLLYDTSHFLSKASTQSCSSRVCGDNITADLYADHKIHQFFSDILQVSCAFARFPAGGAGRSTRHSKAHLQNYQKVPATNLADTMYVPTPAPLTPPDSDSEENNPRPILLSNESPLLVINTASLDELNKAITKSGGIAVDSAVFRANVLIGPAPSHDPLIVDSTTSPHLNLPYVEDDYSSLTITSSRAKSVAFLKCLGACRRCHMVCIDQCTAAKSEEPFITLTKTRRFDGGVFFGVHACLDARANETSTCVVRVGDAVQGNLRSLPD